VKSRKQKQVGERTGMGLRKGEGRDPAGKEGSKQEGETRGGELLRVQTQAGTIQPLWMGRTHAA